MSVLPAAATDDYLDFCAGVHRLCGIDLTQYKRNQMERRIRSFAERRGVSQSSTKRPASSGTSQITRHP